jgi:hypothetical protein
MNLARDGGLVGGARTFEFRFKFSTDSTQRRVHPRRPTARRRVKRRARPASATATFADEPHPLEWEPGPTTRVASLPNPISDGISESVIRHTGQSAGSGSGGSKCAHQNSSPPSFLQPRRMVSASSHPLSSLRHGW